MLCITFADECVEAAYEGYRDVVKEALYDFSAALHKMALENSRAIDMDVGLEVNAEDALSAVLHPSCSRIASLGDIEDVHYCLEKVFPI